MANEEGPVQKGRYYVRCEAKRGHAYEQEVRDGDFQSRICGLCGSPASFARIDAEAGDGVAAMLAASLLARDPERMRKFAASSDPAEQLDDGSLLRVARTADGFRIDHLTRSAPSEPERSWIVGPLGKLLPARVAVEREACSR